MSDLADGEATEMKGSAAKPYELKNSGGVYSCTCPAWRNQSTAIERRSCKHLRKLRGDAAEDARCGKPAPRKAASAAKASAAAAGDGSAPEATAPPLLLAHVWEPSIDLTGWWMSEKLDGVRAYWSQGQLVSRLGNRYLAPSWFTAGLPDVPLDGELWGGRKKFQRTVSIARRQDASEHWRELCFVVFDAPAMDAPFEERMAFCARQLADQRAPYAQHHEHVRCQGSAHLQAELARVEALGGEGLMLRQPASRYEVGRSSTLLKVKRFHDAEARVIDHVAGEGRHTGRMGALVVELADGTRFSVGTGFSDAERSAPPPVDSIITFRYQELSDGGVPRFPSYVGVRDDVAFPARKTAAAAPQAATAAPTATPKAAAAPAAAAATASPASSGSARRFELVEGGASKFWEIALAGDGHIVRFGRIGTKGQEKTKSFADAAAAKAAAAELIAQKIDKGYIER